MSFDKNEIFKLKSEEKRQLAFDLLDSIDEEFIEQPIPEWKKNLIIERISLDKANPEEVISLSELRKKYYDK